MPCRLSLVVHPANPIFFLWQWHRKVARLIVPPPIAYFYCISRTRKWHSVVKGTSLPVVFSIPLCTYCLVKASRVSPLYSVNN